MPTVEDEKLALTLTPSKDHYTDVLRVCRALTEKYGSATNALANLAMQSPEFKKTLAEINKS